MADGQPMRRTEAKAFFANERTFLHWMSMAVTIGSISAALSGIAGHAHRNWGDEFTTSSLMVRGVSLIMLCVAITIAVYAGFNFYVRANMLQLKMDGPYDNRILPGIISVAMIATLLVVFGGAVMRLQSSATSQ